MTTPRRAAAISADDTSIAYESVGLGTPVVVVGGALRSAEDYMPLAGELAHKFEVHVVDRRGRGGSGPQGPEYGIEKECQDLQAVVAATGATRVFGHSYGGLVALEAVKRGVPLTHIAVYEPGVSIDGSIPLHWLPAYAARLARGDTRGAFAELVRGSGHAPAMASRLPLAYWKLLLRFVIKRDQWGRVEPLLQASLAEHAEVRRLDGPASSYDEVAGEVLLLAGTKSPRSVRRSLDALTSALPQAQQQLIEGVAHNAPDEASPAAVAKVLEPFFTTAEAAEERVPSHTPRVSSLSADDHLAIGRLIALHGHLMDGGELDRLDELFTSDVIYDLADFGFGALQGVEAIRDAAVALGVRNPLAHHVTNVVIGKEDELGVHVRSKGLAVNADGSSGSVVYDDVVQRSDVGWRISYRKVAARREPLKP